LLPGEQLPGPAMPQPGYDYSDAYASASAYDQQWWVAGSVNGLPFACAMGSLVRLPAGQCIANKDC
jgi:hypothetical protein